MCVYRYTCITLQGLCQCAWHYLFIILAYLHNQKLTDADGIPLDICDDFRKCITMIQEINSIEFISVKKEFTLTPTNYPDDHVGGN